MATRTDARGAIVTAAGPTMRTILHDLALPTFQRFADRWGYAVRAEELEQDGREATESAQHAKWTKLTLLREALADHPMALWLDADVLVVRFDEDIADHLHPEHFQALALEQVPYEHRVNPNTGVWLLRSCPEALDFLDAVEEAGQQPGPWADQGAVLAALGWRRGDGHYHWAGPGDGSTFLARTSWLPPGWNQPYVDGRDPDACYNSDPESYATRPTVPDPHVVHFMGMTVEARAAHMARCAAAVVPSG
ncbi:MAG TPA: hypothetical protein VFY98_13260 [Intrasporangium sp.]|nr:hypothetical protein [Intrasporangium sp.]